MYSAFSKNNSKVFVNRNKPERAQRTCPTRTVLSSFLSFKGWHSHQSPIETKPYSNSKSFVRNFHHSMHGTFKFVSLTGR